MITIDPVGMVEYIGENFFELGLWGAALFGLLLFLWFLGWAARELWLIHVQRAYAHTLRFVVLAIDIPQENEQTPKAVEQIFAQLHGTLSSPNLKEKWIQGKFQQSFSFEIISLGGYIQFLIRTNVVFRDLVEAAVYAQYPDAEITEVADYAAALPAMFPDSTFNLWATEFVLSKKSAYPIRTYPEFEHTAAEEVFKDPMAALLEVLAKLKTQEQVWLQLLVTPVNDDWKDEGEKLVGLLAGKPSPEKKGGLLEKMIEAPLTVLSALADTVLPTTGEAEKKNEPQFVWSLVQYLTAGEKNDIDAIENKLCKIGYRVKFRLGYLAPHAMFSKARGVAPVVGAVKQFNTINLNAFKGSKLVTTDTPVYGFVKERTAYRQRKFMQAFRARSNHRGAGHGFILNIEELASVWHFPIRTVRAPLVKKTEAKRAEPPVRLPMETSEMAMAMQEKRQRATAGVPANLPTS